MALLVKRENQDENQVNAKTTEGMKRTATTNNELGK